MKRNTIHLFIKNKIGGGDRKFYLILYLFSFGPKKGRIQVGKERDKNERIKAKKEPILNNAFKENGLTWKYCVEKGAKMGSKEGVREEILAWMYISQGGTHGNWVTRGWSKSLETVIKQKVCKYLGNK